VCIDEQAYELKEQANELELCFDLQQDKQRVYGLMKSYMRQS